MSHSRSPGNRRSGSHGLPGPYSDSHKLTTCWLTLAASRSHLSTFWGLPCFSRSCQNNVECALLYENHNYHALVNLGSQEWCHFQKHCTLNSKLQEDLSKGICLDYCSSKSKLSSSHCSMARGLCVISIIFFVSFFVLWFDFIKLLLNYNKRPVGGFPSRFTQKNCKK